MICLGYSFLGCYIVKDSILSALTIHSRDVPFSRDEDPPAPHP